MAHSIHELTVIIFPSSLKRFIEVKINDSDPFNVATIYLPNGNPVDTEKFPYKLDWMQRLKDYAKKKIDNQETVIFGGDYNIIPNRGDAVNIEKWKNDALHHPDSIKIFREIINLGLTDVFRVFNSKEFDTLLLALFFLFQL